MCFGMHHGGDEGLVQCRVAKTSGQSVVSQTLFFEVERRLGLVALDTPGREEDDLIVEYSRAEYLEGNHQKREGCDRIGMHVSSFTPNPNHQKGDEIGQHSAKDEAVEKNTPEDAAALRLGHEDVEKQVLLQRDVDAEVQGGGRKDQRLNRRIAQSDGGVEEEVVVVAGILERRRCRELDHLARRRVRELAHEEAVNQRPKLGQVNGSAELALKKPGYPKRRNGAEGREDGFSKVLLQDGRPSIIAAVSLLYDARCERPCCTKHGEDKEIVEDEEGVQLGHHVSFAASLGLVAGLHRHAPEDGGENQIDEREDGRGRDTLHNRPKGSARRQRVLKRRPETAQIAQIHQEDGNHGVGRDPQQSEDNDPQVVPYPLGPSRSRRQWHIVPDNVVRPWRKTHGRPVGLLLAAGICDRVSLGDVGIRREPVRHRSSLVHLLPNFLDFDFEHLDPLCQVVDSIHLLPFRIRGI